MVAYGVFVFVTILVELALKGKPIFNGENQGI
jgi:hypothetical protein